MARSKVLLYLVYAAIVAGMIVAIVLSFHSGKPTSPKSKPSTGTHQQQSSKSSKGQGSHKQTAQGQHGQSQSSQPKSSSSAGNSSSSTGAQSAPSTGQSGASTGQAGQTGAAGSPAQLDNTGPGDTLAVFAAVSALGTIVYRRYLIVKRV